MSLTATDATTELDISELVDMESEPGCEHSSHKLGLHGHSGPAWGVVLVFYECGCEPTNTMLICESGYKFAVESSTYLACQHCGDVKPAQLAWKLVSIL